MSEFRTSRTHRGHAKWLVPAVVTIALFSFPKTLRAQNIETDSKVRSARYLIVEGRPDSAIALLDSALVGDSTNESLLLALADSYKAARQPKARRATLNRILRFRSRSVAARLAFAEDFIQAKQPDSAASFAYGALTLSNRSSGAAFYWVGRIHEAAGRADSAAVYYRNAWTLLGSKELF